MRETPDKVARQGDSQCRNRLWIMPFGPDASARAVGSPAAFSGQVVGHGRPGLRGKKGTFRP